MLKENSIVNHSGQNRKRNSSVTRLNPRIISLIEKLNDFFRIIFNPNLQ